MNISGIGVDCVEIERFEKIKNKNHFLERIFSKKELDYCFKQANPFLHLSARFAGKEAVIKAMSKIKKLLPEQIEVLNMPDGAPYVKISDKNFSKNVEILISLSHSDGMAIAIAVLSSG